MQHIITYNADSQHPMHPPRPLPRLAPGMRPHGHAWQRGAEGWTGPEGVEEVGGGALRGDSGVMDGGRRTQEELLGQYWASHGLSAELAGYGPPPRTDVDAVASGPSRSASLH